MKKKIIVAAIAVLTVHFASAQTQAGLDPTFGNGDGYVITSDDPEAGNGYFTDICLLNDNKFIALGGKLIQYHQDGMTDSTFGTNGISDEVNGVTLELLPNGKIIVLEFPMWDIYHVMITRLNSNGSKDISFGSNGTTDTVYVNHAKAVFLSQPDGKILLFFSHDVLVENVGIREELAIIRYLPDGTLDTDFGSGGMVSHALHSGTDYNTFVSGAAFTPDGKIVVGGQTYSDELGRDAWYATRLLPDGSLDTSFNHTGMAYVPLDYCKAVAVQPDGKIILGGYNLFNPNNVVPFLLARFNTDGSLDSGFDSTGIADFQWEAGSENKLRDIALQPDGKILMAGRAMNPVTQQYDFALARSLPDGQPDTGFGNNGKLLTAISPSKDDAYAMALLPDSRILLAGGSGIVDCNNCSNWTIARYLPDSTTGLQEAAINQDAVWLYPNPAGEAIHIQNTTDYKIILTDIYSITGRQITAGTGNTLSVKNIAPGAYIAAIHLSNHTVIYRQFIIHH